MQGGFKCQLVSSLFNLNLKNMANRRLGSAVVTYIILCGNPVCKKCFTRKQYIQLNFESKIMCQ